MGKKKNKKTKEDHWLRKSPGDFLGGPVVKTVLLMQGRGLISGWGNNIPHITQLHQKKKTKSWKREKLLKSPASLRIMMLLLFFSNISALALCYTKFIESIKKFLLMWVKFVNMYCARN